MTPDISEERISYLVDAFYKKVRLDPEIGPIFNAVVSDWPHHLSLLKDFWSTVLLTTGRYKGLCCKNCDHLVEFGKDVGRVGAWRTSGGGISRVRSSCGRSVGIADMGLAIEISNR